MAPLDREDNRSWVRMAGILTAIPLALGAGPLVGWWIGQWCDRQFNTEPIGLVLGLCLGLAASASQTKRLLESFSRIRPRR